MITIHRLNVINLADGFPVGFQLHQLQSMPMSKTGIAIHLVGDKRRFRLYVICKDQFQSFGRNSASASDLGYGMTRAIYTTGDTDLFHGEPAITGPFAMVLRLARHIKAIMGMIAFIGDSKESFISFNDARKHGGLFGNGIEDFMPPEEGGIPMDANLFASLTKRILMNHAGENSLDLLIVQLGRSEDGVCGIRERLMAIVANVALFALISAIAGDMIGATMRTNDAIFRAFRSNDFIEIS